MRATLLLLCLLGICSAQLTAIEKDLLLQLHNEKRRLVSPTASNMIEMIWDDTVAASAQAYADTCPGDHSATPFGENLAWGWPSRTVESSMFGWFDEEVGAYTFSTNYCADVCGHYTQVVWATSTRLGCGKKACGTFSIAPEFGAGEIYVCQYSPSGNVNIETTRPYLEGAPCSSCPGSHPYCNDGLCTNVAPPCSSSPCENGVCTDVGSTFSCNCENTGFTGPTCSLQLSCPAIQREDNAYWPQTLSGALAWGNCDSGFLGNPSRVCLNNGTFGPIINPCLPAPAKCPASSSPYANANWQATNLGEFAKGDCLHGYTGVALRRCREDGKWETLVQGEGCRVVPCKAEVQGNARWQQTRPGAVAVGTCEDGFLGRPRRACILGSGWGAITDPCVEISGSCSAQLYGRVNWDATPSGQFSRGTCIDGWQGKPLRFCKANGVWESLIHNHCTRI